jgi:hypothetical protein
VAVGSFDVQVAVAVSAEVPVVAAGLFVVHVAVAVSAAAVLSAS